MRIVGGTHKGRRFLGPPGDATRPTSDRVREAVSSALLARDLIRDAHVLDLYAGTGALGFEMLSRGAKSACAIENDPAMTRVIQENARGLQLNVHVLPMALRKGLAPRDLARLNAAIANPATLVFADPPYAITGEVEDVVLALCEAGLISNDALIVLECGAKSVPKLKTLHTTATYNYGDTTVLFLTLTAPDEA